jgi:hypothetical protein
MNNVVAYRQPLLARMENSISNAIIMRKKLQKQGNVGVRFFIVYKLVLYV